MRLKEHPKIKAWPLSWNGFYEGYNEFPRGEEGTLKNVKVVKDSRLPPHRTPDFLELIIEYEGNEFMGVLKSEDPDFNRHYAK